MNIDVELLDRTPNRAVLRLPSRQFPGLLVQGDSLSNLTKLARAIHGRVKALDDEELRDDAAELKRWLEGALEHYEAVLTAHGIPLPYTK